MRVCNRGEVIIDCCVPRGRRAKRKHSDAEAGADTTSPAITVAENADLHRERQPAIKVHGFHGESRRLFLSTGIFPRPASLPPSRRCANRSSSRPGFLSYSRPNRVRPPDQRHRGIELYVTYSPCVSYLAFRVARQRLCERAVLLFISRRIFGLFNDFGDFVRVLRSLKSQTKCLAKTVGNLV